MKTLKQIVPYKIRRALPIMGLTAASMFMPSCSNDEQDVPQLPTHDIELPFFENGGMNNYSQVEFENVQKYIKDPTVGNIYLYVMDNNDYYHCETKHLNNVRKWFTPHFQASPKVHGRGNFNFPVGVVSPADSIWFVEKGWTINKQLHYQK